MKGYLTALLVALFFVAMYAVSWIATCGIVKLLTMCFGWTFSWPIATGVWLILCLIMPAIHKAG